MKNWLLGLIIPKKVVDIMGKAQEFLNGKKTYLAGTIVLLQGLMLLIEQFIGFTGIGDILEWAKGMATNPAILQIGAGLAVFGIGHKLDKSSEVK